MPRQPRNFANNEIYHLVLRRIEDKLLFIDTDDYYRGIFALYEFNNSNPVSISKRRRQRMAFKRKVKEIVGEGEEEVVEPDKRNKLVEILAFCLMPNHIHILAQQIQDNGITKFMQKLGSGLATYFKKKYEIKLKGHFFQDRFTAVHIENDVQLQVVFVYIHTNPISIIFPEWKAKGANDAQKAIDFIENYKWSSYQDYLGKKNFPSLTKRDLLLEVMGGEKGCKEWVDDWIKRKKKMEYEVI